MQRLNAALDRGRMGEARTHGGRAAVRTASLAPRSAAEDDVGFEDDRAIRQELGKLLADVVDGVLFGLVEGRVAERVGDLDQTQVAAALSNGAGSENSR